MYSEELVGIYNLRQSIAPKSLLKYTTFNKVEVKSEKLTNKSLRMRKSESLVKLSGLVQAVTKMRTGCLRTIKVAIFVVGD